MHSPRNGLILNCSNNFPSSQIKKMPAFLLYPFLRTRDNFNSNTILYYVKLLQAEDNPLRLAFNPLFRNLTYLQALDSPHSGCSACCHYPFQSCSNDIPVLQIQPWIISDPVIACILRKLSLVRKKYLQTFKIMWYWILIFCKKDC